MILTRMILENFRQFKGRQEIVFAEGGAAKNSQCITVLYGENGRGKTGIYRALMFGLYGETKLSQDEQIKASELSLVNRHLLEASPEKEIQTVIEIEFTHNGSRYHIRRSLQGMKKKNGEVLEQFGEALLRIQDADGNTKSYQEPQEILRQINAILDSRVREYFLFDGEKIERLTKANSEQRKEVSAGIRNLLNIDDLEKSISAAEKLCRELDQEVRRKSSGELQKVILEINESEDLVKSLRVDLETIEGELHKLRREKRDIDEQLDKYDAIRGLVEERKVVEQRRDDLLAKLSALESDCRQKTPKIGFAIIQATLMDVFKDLDDKRTKGVIPPVFRSDFIQKLLVDRVCICGRSLDEGTEPFLKLLDWMSKTPKTTEMDAALSIWSHLDSILREVPGKHRDAHQHLIDYANTEDNLNTARARLEKIAEEIGTNERSDASNFETMRKKLESSEISFLADQKRKQDNIDEKLLALKDLNRDRERLENDESIRDTLIRRSQMARDVLAALKGVFEIFKTEAAQTLGKYATAIMERLLDEDGCHRSLKMYHLRSIQNVPPMSPFVSCL